MRTYRRFIFREDKEKVICFLKEQNVKFEQKFEDDLIALYLYDDNLDYQRVASLLVKFDMYPVNYIYTEYTQQEIDEAEWLVIHSLWHNGYPQPTKNHGYINNTYDSSNACTSCHLGKWIVNTY